MAITVPHTPAGNVASTTSNTLAVTITAPTGGNLLVCCSDAFANISSIAGGGVTTWTKIESLSGDANHDDPDIWYGVVDTTPSTTVTITYLSSMSFRAAWVIELAGAQKANENAVVFANDAQGNSDSKVITTTTNGDIIISAVAVAAAGATPSSTIPTGYTTVGLKSIASHGLSVAYLIQTTAGASTMNWTGFASATAWPSLGAVAIKVSGATDVLPLTVVSGSAIAFTRSGVDTLSFTVASRSTVGFTTSGTDRLSLPVASRSTVGFTTSGVDRLSLPIASSSTVAITTSGKDALSLPVSSTSVVAFSLVVTPASGARQVWPFPLPLFLGVVNANQARARSISRQ